MLEVRRAVPFETLEEGEVGWTGARGGGVGVVNGGEGGGGKVTAEGAELGGCTAWKGGW